MIEKHVYKSLPLDDFGNAHYSSTENKTWEFLLNRQKDLIQQHAVKEFIDGVQYLDLKNTIPQHFEITEKLLKTNQWGVEPVPALIQPELFFRLLSQRRFPAANFIRIPEEMDYIKEPDIFHEIFGHCPLLTVKPYADFMFEFGNIALAAPPQIRRRLFRLFWFTIEFGLMKVEQNYFAYGGGILSSKSEIVYSTTSTIPERIKLDPLMALRTPFRIDILQPLYFYIESFDELYELIKLDLIKMAHDSLKMPDYSAKFTRD